MVGQSVQQRSGQPLGAEDLGPLVEGQVGGYQDRALLVSLAEDLEEQFGSGPGQGNEAKLVYDQQLETRQLLLKVQLASCDSLPHHVHG